MDKKPIPNRLRDSAPGSWQILLIILLGAGGLLVTLNYLFSELKFSGYQQQRWEVRDSSNQRPVKLLAQSPLIDTLHVTVHPALAVHSLPKKDITDKNYLDFAAIYFNYNPALLVWMSLVAVMIACSLAIVPVTIKYTKDIYQLCQLNWVRLARAVGLTLLIGALITLTNKNGHILNAFQIVDKAGILVQNPQTVYVFVMICVCSGLVAVCGQFVINEAISKLPESIVDLTTPQQEKTAGQFMLLRHSLKFFLMADATLIVFSVLTTDTIRQAINTELALSVKGRSIFPQQFVYLYGLMFTFYLALLYLPIYYRLKYKGETMAKGLKADAPGAAILNESFLIQESALDSLKVALSILAPVVSSLLPGLLNLG